MYKGTEADPLRNVISLKGKIKCHQVEIFNCHNYKLQIQDRCHFLLNDFEI